MKRIYKTKTMLQALLAVLLMCSITPGIVWSAEVEQVSVGPVTAAFAVMMLGQSKTYNVDSDLYPATIIIPVMIFGVGDKTGSLNITVSKTDTSGELFGVLQVGGYNPLVIQTKYGAAVGVTPRTITLNARFYEDSGLIVVMAGLLVSSEEGPHRYSISLSAN